VLATVAVLAVLVVAGGAVAQRRADRAAVVAPRSALDMRRIGHHAYRAGEYELARRFFERATVLDSTDQVARAELGCALLRTGHPLEAEQAWARAGHAAAGTCIALARDTAADTSWLPVADAR
jgi:Flp pilus assembly protein TadD